MHAQMVFSPCVTSMAKSATLAAFCISNRKIPFSRRPQQFRSISDIITLHLSQSPNEQFGEAPKAPPSPDDKDWYMDGRDAARQLKIELGIMSEEDGVNADEGDGDEGEMENKFAATNAAMESGRAAARALLEEMNANNSEDGDEAAIDAAVVENAGNAEKVNKFLETKSEEPEDRFNLPSRKSHCMTICLVPPPSATQAWEQLTAVRRECKDPGFFRWPPHANIVYPFIDPVYDKDSEESKDVQRTKFREGVALHLAKAAEKCKPFDVTIDTFGTFGGKQRGVLWGYPKSRYAEDSDDDDKEEPLMSLYSLLEQQFPMCKDQRKNGAFHPHITISHYLNNDDALAAMKEVESNWEPVSFHVPEIYLLERKGDEGQFKIAATIPLGAGSEVDIHDTPIPFPAMPQVEEEWVHIERMGMKTRRKKSNRRRRGGSRGKSKERNGSPQTKPGEKS